jgi:hypothetical protein
MCSAYDTEENIHRGIESGMKEILGKPVNLK